MRWWCAWFWITLGAIFGDFAGARFVLDDLERIARHRHARQAEYFDRHRRTGFLELCALVVDQRADLAALGADDEDVADLERAARDEHGRDRAAALVELGLDHSAFGGAIGIGAAVRAVRPGAGSSRSACRARSS